MDLNATVQTISQMAVDAKKFQAVETGDPRKLTFLERGGTEIREIAIPPDARRHTVDAIDDFIAACQAAKEEFWGDAKPVIWFGDNFLVLVINDADRRDIIRTPLVLSPHYLTLRQYDVTQVGERVKRLAQKPFLELLKITLRGCVVNGDVLINAVNAITFRKTENGGANVARGRESLDVDVVAEAAGWKDVAEEWQVTLPVFWNEGERSNQLSVLCHVDLDLEEQKFIFRPLPGELDLVLEEAKEKLRERILSGVDGIPVYYGTP